MKIDSGELPAEALAWFSDGQLSYLDEFTFIREESGMIQGWYAGELLAVWDGIGWSLKIAAERRNNNG